MITIYIIVPVFKVEKYLSFSVDSLLNQTYKNINIILVDDGSPDKCPELCDRYAECDSRIIVIHQKNAGLSAARTAGLQYIESMHSLTENVYVGFLDSDDWLAADTIEYCTNLLDKYNADIVQYQIYQVFGETFNVTQPNKSEVICNGREEILQYYMKSTTTGVGGDYSVCQCLFPLKAVAGERFRVGKINEDIDFKYKVLSKCHKMVITNQYKYFYRQGDVTISMGGLKIKDFDLYEVGDIIANLTSQEVYGDIAHLGKVKQARTPFSLLCKIAFFGVADSSLNKEYLIKTLSIENRKNLRILLNSPMPLSRKVLAIQFAISYNFAFSCICIAKYFKRLIGR